ncbi:MAG TPA: hypothetical protein VH253_00400 [Phycisphaerae bacterium]|nr:hypothetical protein [Phycisphaerae bacterium]
MRRTSAVRPLDQLEARTLFSITFYAPFDAFSALAADNAGNVYATVGSTVEKIHKNTDGSLDTSLVVDGGQDGPVGGIVYNGVTNKLFFATIDGLASVNTDGTGLTQYDVNDPVSGRAEFVATLAVGSDGSVWFGTLADSANGDLFSSTAVLGRVTADGTLQSTDIPSTTQAVGYIAAASDGSVWVTNNGDNDGSTFNDSSISHVTVTAGGVFSFTDYSLPNPQDPVGGIAVAGDGSVWVLTDGAVPTLNIPATDVDTLVHVTFDAGGAASTSQVAIPHDTGEGNTAPSQLSIDSSGNLWFAELELDQSGAPVGGRLSNYNTSTGVFDRELLANGEIPITTSPVAIVNGANGPTDVWIGAYDPTTFDGNLVDDALPQATTSFSVNGRSLAGTEDVALAATVPGVSTLAVGTFSGPAGNYTVSIAWSDGTTSAGQIVTGTDGQQYIALAAGATKTFATQGQYTGTISVSDGTTTQTAVATISVAPAIVASQGVTVSPIIGRLVLSVTTTFTSAIAEPASAFTVTIAWGDGTTTKGLVVRNPLNTTQYYVIGIHNYRSSGSYTITTTILNASLNETATGTAFIHV